MHLFPPSPKNTAAAIAYVKSIPRRSGATDLQALRNSAKGAIGVLPLFFFIMATRLQGGTTDADAVIVVAFGVLGIVTMILAYRTLALIDLFTFANLPPLESSPDRGPIESKMQNKACEATGDNVSS